MIKKKFLRPLSTFLLAALMFVPNMTKAQTSIALPSTMTTLAGGLVPTTYTANTTVCPGTASTKASTASGDNCASVAATLGAAGRGGVAVDQFGNVFVADDVSLTAHMIDASTGVMTVLAGGGTVCSGKVDKMGDGCLAATQTLFSSGIRGIGIDPYGNVLIAGYGDNTIHMVCRTASPLCTASTPSPSASTPIQIQVGYMGVVAGCEGGTSAAGISGQGVDNTPGFTTAAYSVTAFKNSGTCSTSKGETISPRGATADIYGNVYFADTGSSRTRVVLGPLTSSYFNGNNPLYAALKTHWASPVAGYAYSVTAPGSATAGSNNGNGYNGAGSYTMTAGAACSDSNSGTTYAGTAADIRGDSCPFWYSSVNSGSGYTSGVANDMAGNMLFTDPGNGSSVYGGLRVLYVQGWPDAATAAQAGATGAIAQAGVAMYKAIVANNSGITPTPGFVYALSGKPGMQSTVGGTAPTAAPILGNSAKIIDSSITKLTVSPQGNVYIGDNAQVLFYDMTSGTIRILLKAGASPAAAGAYCNGTSGAIARSKYGDGCPVSGTTSYANFGNSNGLGVAVDAQGNLYLYDSASYGSGMLVRKVLAQGTGTLSKANLAALATVTAAQPLQALGTTQTQTFAVHIPNATVGWVQHSTNPNFTYGTPSCTGYSALDNSLDCNLTVTYTPSAAGPQSASFTILTDTSSTATVNLGGTVAGAVLAIDGARSGSTSLQSTATELSGMRPYAVAVDGAGNLYAAVANGSSYAITEALGGDTSSVLSLLTGLTSKPTTLAVDQTGNIFYTLAGTSAIQELAVNQSSVPNTYTATTLTYVPTNFGTPNPVALAVDSFGNLLVADDQSGTDTLYKLSPTAFAQYGSTGCNGQVTGVLPTLCQSVIYGNVSSSYAPLTAGVVSALAMDPAGNIYAADSTNAKIYQLTPGIDATLKIQDYTANTLLSTITATGLAADAAGDLYVQSASGVTMYPQSGPTSAGVQVVSGSTAPSGIAVDGLGKLYNADGVVTQITRNTLTEDFQSDYALVFSAQLSNVGSQAAAAQSAANGVNAGAFTLSGGSNACVFTNNLLNAMNPGQSCSLVAQFPAIGNGPDFDYIAFTPTAPAATAVGQLTLTGVADQKGYTTTTTVGTASNASPVFVASGTEVSFPLTVTANSLSTDGSASITDGPTTSNYVLVSVDSGAAATYNFTSTSGLNASVTLNLAGLAAGTHSFAVNFPQQGSFLPSSATSATFTVAQAPTAIAWTPTNATQQVSAALGIGVLNATVTPAVLGNFAYALGAAPSCTNTTASTTTPVDASTYLPIGSYTIYATFCPTDSIDYISSGSSISYTVTQASTTAAVGASTMVVATSGGNFTSLTAALQALPATGGTIYIAPGTYTGQNAISYPNVQLRGLGGDATQVILSGENGAFSASLLPTYTPAGGTTMSYTLGPAGKGGDEGSATLDVSKNGYMGQAAVTSGITPNNFYAEYLTIQNTYNTSSSTTSTYSATSNAGTCSAGSTAQTLQYLYNNNQQCGSQALALFLNSDSAVLNNVNLLSQQDTLYASSIGCGTYCTVAREYMWKGLITGNVDYTFGDAALVFDHTNFFTTWHGLTATNNETITAQNKRYPTGSTNGVPNSTIASNTDYLSGFVCNGCTLLSQSAGMTKLYYGRPWNISTSSYPSSYSTWVMLNSNVDQVNAAGWIGWDGASQYLSTSTYGEFNTMAYTDPAAGTYPYPAALYNSTPSVLYASNVGNATASSLVPTAGNSGAGATSLSSRESFSLKLSAATAAPWYPVDFLSTTVPATKLSSGQSATWNPVAALAAQVNNFVPVASVGAIANGGSVTILGRPQTPGAGVIPTGSYAFYDSLNTNQACTTASSTCTLLASGVLDAAGEAFLTTSSLASGTHYVTMTYGGDTNFAGSASSTYSIYVLNPGQSATTTALAVANTSSTTGTPIAGTVTLAPTTADGVISIYLDGIVATTCTLASGTCSWSINGPTAGAHTMYASYPGNTAYGHSASSTVSLYVVAPVATGDTRTVTEPSFPSVCTPLIAALTTNPATLDLDQSVDASVSNIDGARIQAALNSCSTTATAQNTQLAVELSMDSSATYNAFLSGPLSMPSNVTLLVDPGVTLYFSRNVQDYDKVAGTHTCGTINGGSNTGSCWPLIDIPGTSSNVGIMGYGKIDGRGNDLLLNTFTTSGYSMPSTPTWWNLASTANGTGSQMNPRFIQMDSGAHNITLYKITIKNAPNFHVSTTGSVSNFIAWGVKIVTPTAARNTDGIDPGSMTNATITQSWISDGDDNVAVGASGTTKPAANISVTNNHFFAGHGESIGSYTSSGVTNVLFDHNMSVGNAFAGHGSAVDANGLFSSSGVADTNSTAIRIKTANDRGGLVTQIQYSNSCFLDHKADVQFTPYYSSGLSNLIPSYTGILMQNLVFLNDASSSGTVEMTGEYNSNNGSPIANPLTLTMDNVTFPTALSSLVNSTSPVESTSVWGSSYSGGTGQYTNLTIGPGNVSSNFLTAYNTLVANSANADTLTSNVSLSTLNAPACVFTFLALELTGPNNVAQTVPYGSNANVDVILTPAVGGAAFPTGTVTVTDTTTSNTFTGTLSGSNDTLPVTIPASDLTLGTHTFTATYLGDSNYTIPASYQTFGSYQITVIKATPVISWSPAATAITYGTTLNGLLNATSSVPGGIFTYTATPTAGGNAVTVTNSTVLTAGSYSLTASYVPADPANYNNASTAFTLTVNKATPVLAWATPTAISYGTTLASSLNPTASFASATVAGGFTYTAVSTTGGTAVAVTSSTVLAAGSWNLVATFTPTDTTNYISGGTTSTTLAVGKLLPTVTVAASAATVVLQNPVTFTANVKSSASTPTGSVNFLDGTTILATVPLTAGVATYTTSGLALGSHSISVAYLGDSNFQTLSTSATAVTVLTVSIGTVGPGSGTGTGSGNSQVILPGGIASYVLPILPNTGSSFPIALTLSVSGLPTGASANVTPNTWAAQVNGTSWILPANTTLSGPTQLNISMPAATASNKPADRPFLSHVAPVVFALLLLPFAGRIRRSGKRMARMLSLLLILAAGAAATAGFTGCGGTGFFSTPAKTYTITVTVTAGNLTQTTNLNLTVE